MNCPRCNGKATLTTPDYGYGYGAEFACYNSACSREGRFTFASSEPDALAESDASRGASAANAAAYRASRGD